MTPDQIATFLAANPGALCAELTLVRGSSPRDEGAYILVGADATLGTIGGGALEFLVIARARRALAEGLTEDRLDVPLGPEIGQCCGGRVEVKLRALDRAGARRLIAGAKAEAAGRPNVFIFGAGHVGRALARALAPLPLKVAVIDTRPEFLHDLPDGITGRAVAMPEAVVRGAPEGSSYVILTHDHALDFLIGQEALRRQDAPYVGMIGSGTKRARFAHWFLGEGGSREALERLVLPIGGAGARFGDKRPEVIAALAAGEMMAVVGGWGVEGRLGGVLTGTGGTGADGR